MLLFLLVMGNDAPGGGFGYFTVGYFGADMSALNDVLESRGFDRLSGGFIMRGGNGYGLIGRILIGGGGFGLGENTVRKGNTVVRLTGGGGGFELGYLIFRSKNFFLFPRVSMGGGGWNLVISSTDPVNFDDALSGDYREAKLEGGSYMLGAGLLLLYRYRGMVFTLSAGYNYTGRFYLNGRDYDVRNSPQMNFSGFYVNVGFGGGYIGG